MFSFTGSRLVAAVAIPSSPAASITASARYGFAAGSGDRNSSREPVNENIYEMSFRERRRLRIDDLPRDLNEACDELEKDSEIQEALGTHVCEHFLAAKREEWREYISQVSAWELEHYLAKY